MLNSLIQTIAKILVAPLLVTLSLSGNPIVQPQAIPQQQPIIQQVQVPSQNQNLGSFNPTAGTDYYLEGGINTTATTLYLSSFKEPVSNIPYTMAYLNSSIEYGVLDPGNANRSEIISFTGITQNADGSATISGITRGLSRSYPFTASTTLAQTHAAQAQFILSDSPQIFTQYAAKQNNETITGEWSFPTPLGNNDPATKTYVDSHVNGGTVSNNQIIVAGKAGETMATGTVLYFNQANAEWFKAATTLPEASSSILGIAEGSGTAGNNINTGVLLSGVDSNQTGLTAGMNYFLTNTTGAIGTATTTRIVGRAQSVTQLYFNTSMLADGLPALKNNFTQSNTFASSTTFTSTATSSNSFTATSSVQIGSFPAYSIGKNIQVFTNNGTFLGPPGVAKVMVQAIGGGGGGGPGGNNSVTAGAGGGAGGYVLKYIDMTATTSLGVTIGTGGGGGGAGGTTTVGSYIYAGAGGPGTTGSSGAGVVAGGYGGTGIGGDVNILGGPGFQGAAASSDLRAGEGGVGAFGGYGSYGSGGNGGAGQNVGGTGGSPGIVIFTW